MNKILYTITLLVALLTGLASCSNETLVDQEVLPQGKGNSVIFKIDGLTPVTRATPVPNAGNPTIIQTPALDREKAIADGKLYAVVFHRDGTFWKSAVAQKVGTGNAYNFDLAKAGDFDLYLVANPDAALVAQLSTLATATQFDALVAKQTPGEDNTATNFLMTSKKKEITTVASQSTDAGSIKLERVAARFDIYNRIELLKMTKVTFKNRYAESRLARGAANMSMNGLTSADHKVYTSNQGLADYECIGAIYGYENMELGNTVLTLEATYNGKAIGAYDIVVGGIPVKRNHLYSIIISSKGESVNPDDVFGSLKFDIVVNDWQEGATLEWKGSQLVDRSRPDYVLSGTNVTIPNVAPGVITVNPAKANVSNQATDVTVTIYNKTVAAALRYAGESLPAGYSIVPGETTIGQNHIKDGTLYLIQTYTIKLPANTGVEKNLDFVVENTFDTTAKGGFTLVHAGASTQPIPKMPLEYVAEYNLRASNPAAFANTNDAPPLNTGTSGWALFTHEAAKALGNIVIAGKGYHVATLNEWVSIFGINRLSFTNLDPVNDAEERTEIKGVMKQYTSDYRPVGGNVVYALRHKSADKEMLSAYRYEYIAGNRVKVTSRYLGPSFTGSVSDVARASFWEQGADRDVSRLFPLWGHVRNQGDTPRRYGSEGYYLVTITPAEAAPKGYFGLLNEKGLGATYDTGETMEPDESGLYVFYRGAIQAAVRLFSNE